MNSVGRQGNNAKEKTVTQRGNVLMEKREQARTAANQPAETLTESATEAPALAGKYISELLSQAENAYTMYRQAQKEVAKGYKKQEEEMEKAFTAAEKRANEAYEKALDKALKSSEQAERQAEEAHRKALEKTRDEYVRSIAEAQKLRDDAVAEARQKSTEGREQAWSIFQGGRPE